MLAVRACGRRVCYSHPLAHLLLCIPRNARRFSVQNVDPILRDFTKSLAQKQPAFLIASRNISVFFEPSEFYSRLLDMIRRAERRIFISSLYIGSSKSDLIEALRQTLKAKPGVQLHLQLDFNRSTRPGPSSTVKMLVPLIQEFPSQVRVNLFRSPHLRGLMAKIVPPRFNEGWGTWHAKIYGVDDEVMISGANLNESYFTNRQDRYLHFQSEPILAQYCFDFLQKVSDFSYRLLPSSASDVTASCRYSQMHDGYVLHWPDSATHPHRFHKKAAAAFSGLQTSYRLNSNLFSKDSSKESSHDIPKPNTEQKVCLMPIIQAGQFAIQEEETALAMLFNSLNNASKLVPASQTEKRTSSRGITPVVDLTSGYFGLYKLYQELVLSSSSVITRIIAASPKANGFYGSRGLSGRIPEGYTLLEQRFIRAVEKAGRSWKVDAKKGEEAGVQLSEWERPGWTYHAKGIWVSPDSSSPPVLTLFGSTNLNSRSAHIDTELSFIMILPSEAPPVATQPSDDTATLDLRSRFSVADLRRRLADELRNLRSYAVEWRGAHRKVRSLTKIIVLFVGGML